MQGSMSSPPRIAERLPRPQFTLRALLGMVALVAAWLTLARLLSTTWAIAVTWLLVLVAGHVAGNFLGTRLRGERSARQPGDTAGDTAAAEQPRRERPIAFAPLSGLREHRSLNRRVFVTAAVGAIGGMVLGAMFLLTRNLPHLGLAGLVVGSLSAGIIGGLLAFLTSSCLSVLAAAWREGWEHQGSTARSRAPKAPLR
jgi:hypothetical protein